MKQQNIQTEITCNCGAKNYSSEVIFGCWSCGAKLKDKRVVLDSDAFHFAIGNLLEQGIPKSWVKEMIKRWKNRLKF